MQKLADKLGLRFSSYIKNLEESRTNPNKDVSHRLAVYFKLDTKYFYDPYFEDTEDYDKKLYNYRMANSLTIDDICKQIGISYHTWYAWENKKAIISRRNYLKLKDLKIL